MSERQHSAMSSKCYKNMNMLNDLYRCLVADQLKQFFTLLVFCVRILQTSYSNAEEISVQLSHEHMVLADIFGMLLR